MPFGVKISPNITISFPDNTNEEKPKLIPSVEWVNVLNKPNFDILYYPINSNPAGYLTEYIETDPEFSASPASGITAPQISQWNAAYFLAHSAVSVGTGNGLSLNGQILSLQTANATQPGALSNGDWNTFNNKQAVLTFNNGLTNTANTVTNDLITGKSGGQNVYGGTGSGENLILNSTSHATKGSIFFGSNSRFYGASANLQVGRTTDHQLGIELYNNTTAISFGQYPIISVNNPNAAGYAAYGLHKGDGVSNMRARWLIDPNDNVTFGGYQAGKNLFVTTNGVPRITIKGDGANNGFIGININTPNYRYHVQSGASTESVFALSRSNNSVAFAFTEVSGAARFGWFGVAPVGQQTGGAATAGAVYDITVQAMVNATYTAMRNYGLLT